LKKKLYLSFISIILLIIIIIGLIIFFQPSTLVKSQGDRKAIILCSANDFYGSEVEEHFSFEGGAENWTFEGINSAGDYTSEFGNETAGSIYIKPLNPDYISANFSYMWQEYHPLYENSFYNISASIYINSTTSINGNGVEIGLQWLNSSMEIVRTDWSNNLNSSLNQWNSLNLMSLCDNFSDNKIEGLKLIMSVKGAFSGGAEDDIYFDDIKIDKWTNVNFTDPFDPNNRRKNSDGFPAQALQVYKILKNHDYTDDNIFLMLYHTGDNVIDINAGDSVLNDLGSNVLVDVENDAVNASRFNKELNVSIDGSFASNIQKEDQLIIFITDHGANNKLGDGNATFHFEADKSFITEKQFYNLVKNIKCKRKFINVDCCFSGNFLNEKKPIGSAWFELENCILISSSADRLSWYWIDNKNPNNFAGSWFFHIFWDQLDQNQTIYNAFNFAIQFIPAAQVQPLLITQIPLLYDNMGINNSWGFNSINKL